MNEWAIALVGGAVGALLSGFVSEVLHRRRDARRVLEVVRSEIDHQRDVLAIWLEHTGKVSGRERRGPRFPAFRVLDVLGADSGVLPSLVQDRTRSLAHFLQELKRQSETLDERTRQFEEIDPGARPPDSALTAFHERLLNVRIAVERSSDLLRIVDTELARTGAQALRSPV
jgi:hypothetical protein